jgi:hypothetical protein
LIKRSGDEHIGIQIKILLKLKLMIFRIRQCISYSNRPYQLKIETDDNIRENK